MSRQRSARLLVPSLLESVVPGHVLSSTTKETSDQLYHLKGRMTSEEREAHPEEEEHDPGSHPR
jgi:hypothetical protein